MTTDNKNVIRETAAENKKREADSFDISAALHFGVHVGESVTTSAAFMQVAKDEVLSDNLYDREGRYNPWIPNEAWEDPQVRAMFYGGETKRRDILNYYERYLLGEGRPSRDEVLREISDRRVHYSQVFYTGEQTNQVQPVTVRPMRIGQGHMNTGASSDEEDAAEMERRRIRDADCDCEDCQDSDEESEEQDEKDTDEAFEAWLLAHPRYILGLPPFQAQIVMNQVESWGPERAKRIGQGHMKVESGFTRTEFWDDVDRDLADEISNDVAAKTIAGLCKQFGDVHLNVDCAKTESRWKKRFKPSIVLIKKGENFIPRKGARLIELGKEEDVEYVTRVLRAYKKAPPLTRADVLEEKLRKRRDGERRKKRDEKGQGHAGVFGDSVMKAVDRKLKAATDEVKAEVASIKDIFRDTKEHVQRHHFNLADSFVGGAHAGIRIREEAPIFGALIDTAIALPAIAVFVIAVHKLKKEVTARWVLAAIASGTIMLAKCSSVLGSLMVPFLALLRKMIPAKGHMHGGEEEDFEKMVREDPAAVQVMELLRNMTLSVGGRADETSAGYTSVYDNAIDYKSRFCEQFQRWGLNWSHFVEHKMETPPLTPGNPQPGKWLLVGELKGADGRPAMIAPCWGEQKREAERMMYWKFMRWMKWNCCHPECVFKEHWCDKKFAKRFGAEDYMEVIAKHTGPTPIAKGKGHGFTEDLISTMSRIGALAIVAVTAKTAPQGKTLEKVMGFVGNFGKNVEGMHDFGTTAVALLEGVVNTLNRAVGVDQISWLETSIAEVDHWREEAFRFINHHSKANMSAITRTECDTLYQRYCRLCGKFPTGKVSQVIRMACGPLVKDLERIRAEFSSSGIGLNGAKPRPLWVHIVGAPGVGKSLSMIPVFRRILLRDMIENGATPEQLEALKKGSYDHAYIINSFEEYMSGYFEQFAVLGDDFAQFIHAKGDPGEFNKYFVFAGEFPANVTMADLGSKGNTYARSRFIFTTSNATIKELDKQLREDILTSPEAMVRRMDMVFYCYPAEKYRKDGWEDTGDQLQYRLDTNKLPKGAGFVKDAMVFQRMRAIYSNGMIDRVEGDPKLLTLDRLTDAVFAEFSARTGQSAAYTKEIDDDFAREVDEAIADMVRTKARGQGHMKAEDVEEKGKGPAVEEEIVEEVAPPVSMLKGAGHIPDDQQRFIWGIKAKQRGLSPPDPNLEESDFEYAERAVDVWREDSEFAEQLCSVLKQMPVDPERLEALISRISAATPKDEIDIRLHSLVTRGLSQKYEGPLDDTIVWEMVGTTCRPSYESLKDTPRRDEVWLKSFWPLHSYQWYEYYEKARQKRSKEDVLAQEKRKMELVEAGTWMDKLKNSAAAAASKVKDAFSAYFEFTGWWGIAAPIIAGTLLAGGLAWYYFSGSSESESDGEGHSVHRPMNRGPAKRKGAGHGVDNAVYDIADAVWNSCFFTLHDEKGGIYTHSIVTGKEAIFPRHVKEFIRMKVADKKMRPDAVLSFKPVSAPGMPVPDGFKVKASQIADAWSEGLWEKRDLAFITLPIQKRADIRNYLFSEKDAYLSGDEQDILLLLERHNHPGHQMMIKVNGQCYYGNNEYEVDEKTYTSERVVDVESGLPGAGDCCSPYFVIASDSGAKKLLALHIAGNNQTWSLGTIFSREMYDTMDGMRKKTDRVFPELPPTGTGHMCLALDGRETPAGGAFQAVGRLTKPVWQPWETELRKAFEGNEWAERKLAPAPINRKEAFHKAVEPYGKPPTPLTEEDQKMVKLAALGWLSTAEKAVKNKKAVPRRVLTEHEAIFGGEKGSALGEHFTAMNFATSPGIIIGEEIKGPGKREFFYRTSEGEDIITEKGHRLINRVKLQIAMMKKGIRPFFVFRDFLKDELRKQAKVDAGMARFISGSPLDYQMLCRMYFGAFSAFIQQGYTKNGTAIGLNPFHGDWHQFATILRQYAKFNAGDFARYDTSLHPEIMLAICDMINVWYNDGEENAQIRRLLFLEVVNSRHVFFDVVYEWHGSEPSGHPLTAILNSIYTSIVFRLTYGHKNPKGKWAIVEFDDHCYFMGLGDDHVQANDEYAAAFMTPGNVKEIAERYGMSYTTAEKEEVTSATPLLPFEKVTFLKRGFLYGQDFGEWCAPLALDTVLEMALWSRGDTALERTRNVKQTFDHAVVELSLHPREVYETWSPKMFKAFKAEYRYEYPIQDYEVLRQKSRHPDFAPGGW